MAGNRVGYLAGPAALIAEVHQVSLHSAYHAPTAAQRPIRRTSAAALAAMSFAAGSMGPKVDAACRFAEATGKTAAIGALADIAEIVRGEKGTLIGKHFQGLSWH